MSKDVKNIKTIKDCFDVILKGDKKESGLARKKVRKIIYGSGSSGEYKHIKDIAGEALKTYEKIKESWRQENFIVALATIHFLRDYKKYPPDYLFPLLLALLQHSNGNIRYAAVRMLREEIAPLTLYLRFPEEENKKNREEKLEFDSILYWLYVGLIRLSDSARSVSKINYSKYKYIEDMPSSVYKSIQLVFADMIEMCGEDNIHAMRRSMVMREDDL